MANKHSLNENTPANTDDALEGPQRIREIKQAYNERISRDHLIGGSAYTSGDVLASGADSYDSGYHRRITIKEETSAQGGASDTRLNASSTGINHGTTLKMAEVWMEKHSGTSDETSMLFLGTEGTGNQRTVVTDGQEQTLTNKTLTAPVINDAVLSGGSGGIDGVPIGQRAADPSASPDPILAGAAAGKFTTLESTDDTIIGAADTDILTLKAKTSGKSSDHADGGFTGANSMYAGMVGEIRMYGGSTEPEGWIFCDGRQVLHTGSGNYSELYAAIGLAYTDTSEHGSSGNKRSSGDYFRIPNLCGRIPVGKGTGADTDGTELGTGALTARALGDYGADEEHTLTAGESGAGPHYHPVDPQAHTHTYDLWHATESGVTYYGNAVQYLGDNAAVWGTKATNATTSTIKASHELDVTGTTETSAQGADSDDTFRTDKTDLNTGVPAASGHTQMQPFVVINYIIKY